MVPSISDVSIYPCLNKFKLNWFAQKKFKIDYNGLSTDELRNNATSKLMKEINKSIPENHQNEMYEKCQL